MKKSQAARYKVVFPDGSARYVAEEWQVERAARSAGLTMDDIDLVNLEDYRHRMASDRRQRAMHKGRGW